MTMVEKVARASFACWRKRMDELGLHLDKGRTFENMSKSELEFALDNSRAVIAAIREPSEEMLDLHPPFVSKQEFLASYKAMIDAALK